MQNEKDGARIRRGHGLSEEERAAVDEERTPPDAADREVDQPPKRSQRETRKRERGDRGAADVNPDQFEEFTRTEREPSQREHGSDSRPDTIG